jgi:hypothetical protein
MKLIIKKDTFDTDRIHFKNNKTGVKLMYNITDVYMIGIPLKINYEKIIVKDCIIFLNIDGDCFNILRKIDGLFRNKINNYITFLHNDKMLKIKKHSNFSLNDTNDILISINCIRSYKEKNYVQIFTI